MDDELLRPGALMTPQVRGVVQRLQALGFTMTLSEDGDGAFAAQREADRGLVVVARWGVPPVLWLRFAGWPRRTGTLAEVRRWCETFSESR